MRTTIDLLIHGGGQLLSLAGGPRRGAAAAHLDVLVDGAVAVDDGRIVAVGPSAQLRGRYTARQRIDAAGKLISPGFVDCHTHVVYAGDRAAEFEQRLQGADYLDILAAGGGILSTMRAVRAASLEQLVAQSRERLTEMLRLGTTTAESKSGYGLSTESELKQLEAMALLEATQPVELLPTLLAAHAIPPEFKGDPQGYVDQLVEETAPAAAAWYAASLFARRGTPLGVDVFCEKNAFSLNQSRRVLEAGIARGMLPTMHVDEFSSLGGVALAVELGARSADHLDVTRGEDIARLGTAATAAVLLPAVGFHLSSAHWADGRGLVDAGALVALSTDLNPGSAPCPSLPLVMALGCRQCGLTPAEALYAVTINAAQVLGIAERLGSLEPGKQADLLLLDLPDWRHLVYRFGGNPVAAVFKKGVQVV